MSVSIISSPKALSWARNRNSYVMSCNWQESVGTSSLYRWVFSGTMPAAGSFIVIEVDGAAYPFLVVSSANNNSYKVATVIEIGIKMAACWHLQQIFNTSSNEAGATGSKYLNLTGKVPGYHKVEIYVTDSDGNKITSMLTINRTLGVTGSDPAKLPNYGISAQVEVQTNSSNNVTTHTIKGLMFHPDNDALVKIPFDFLGTLCPQPDLPPLSTSSSAWGVIANLLMKYRLSYGEMWGDARPLMQNWTTLDWCLAFCGEEGERFAEMNMPDWSGDSAQFSVTNNAFRVLGEDSGQTIRLCRSQADYIYGMWYDPTQAANVTKTVDVSVSKDGGISISTSKTVNNGQIYRIPVGPSALGATTAKYYTVTISMGGRGWNRTFIVQPDFYSPTRILLQSKYGYLRNFVVPTAARDINTEAEDIRNDNRRYLDTTDKAETYTVKTQPMTQFEARRLAQCIGNEFNYVQNSNRWLRITVEAGSFKVWDEDEDMVSVEFQYRFVENQEENIMNGNLPTGGNYTTVDAGGNMVTLSDSTEINGNVLIG